MSLKIALMNPLTKEAHASVTTTQLGKKPNEPFLFLILRTGVKFLRRLWNMVPSEVDATHLSPLHQPVLDSGTEHH